MDLRRNVIQTLEGGTDMNTMPASIAKVSVKDIVEIIKLVKDIVEIIKIVKKPR